MKKKIWLAAVILVLALCAAGCQRKAKNPAQALTASSEAAGEKSNPETGSEPETSLGAGTLGGGVYTSGDGGFSLEIPENTWIVEKDDDGGPIFIKKSDENVCFFASKWEGMAIDESFDFSAFYDSYYEGVQKDHPEAKKTAFSQLSLDGQPAVSMGVGFNRDGVPFDVRMILVSAKNGTDCYCFTMSLDEETAKTAAEEFFAIVGSVRLAGNREKN